MSDSYDFRMAFDRRELAAFLTVCRKGSVGAAAEELSLTQPAISRTLARLESRMGTKLFVRQSTGMELTASGEVFLPHAELVEAETRRTLEEIEALKGNAKGLVRIGVIPSVASTLLPQALNGLIKRFPSVRVRILEGTGDQLVAAVLKGSVEFAVVGLWKDPFDANVSVTPLVEDEICALGRWDHPVFAGDSLDLIHLRKYRWAMPEKGNVIWNEFRLMFRRAGLEPPSITVEANSVHILKNLVATSDFLTMLARDSFRDEEKQKSLRSVLLPLGAGRWVRQVGMIRRSADQLTPAARTLFSEIRRAAGQR